MSFMQTSSLPAYLRLAASGLIIPPSGGGGTGGGPSTGNGTGGFSLSAAANAQAVAQGYLPSVFATSRPVTQRLTLADLGVTAVYDVYADGDLDLVPWNTLAAGNVINIMYKATPYTKRFCIHGQGTAASRIIVNGVTDASGNLPTLDCNNSTFAAGSSDIISNDYGWPGLGGILITHGKSDGYHTYKAQYVTVQNMRIQGGRAGNTYYDLLGTAQVFGSCSGIYCMFPEHVVIDNCEGTDNAYGIFTQARNMSIWEATGSIEIRNSAFWGNGVDNNDKQHNLYIQSMGALIENNFIGQTRTLSKGSSFKDRSSGTVFRRNMVIASLRATDFVHTEDSGFNYYGASGDGIYTQPDWGLAYIYENLIINDYGTGKGASSPIHWGCDNIGEEDYSVGAPGHPVVNSGATDASSASRQMGYFYNNTVIMRATLAQSYYTNMLDISWLFVNMDARNNCFYLVGDSNWSWLYYSGTLASSNNAVYVGGGGPAIVSARANAQANKYSCTVLDPIAGTSGMLTNASINDVRPVAGGPLDGTAITNHPSIPTEYQSQLTSVGCMQ